MGRLLKYTVFAILLWSCHKEAGITPKSMISLTQKDINKEIAIENIDAQWNYTPGVLTITGEGIDHELVKLYLPDVRNTSTINNLDIHNISYADDTEFMADTCIDGSVSITSVSEGVVSGRFTATLQQQNMCNETKSITGSFTVYKD
jgi:hypothetical protein